MWRHPLGEVSGGTDASTGARVQVIALNPGSVVSDALIEAARQAARIAAGVASPAVVRPIDVQRMPDGRIAIATEPLEGTPLTNISRNQPLPVTRSVAVLRQLCKALAAAHATGLVHRALTLGSLVVRARTERPDTLAVTDFGIGPLLEGEITILKEDAALQPVSPERISGAQHDAREDQYLMGCIAYSMFTGGSPFRTGTPEAVRRRHAIEDPMQIADRLKGTRGVHPALAAWVHRCLAKEPDDRFENVAQAEAALCLAQIEAHVETPWDDLPIPDTDASTRARIAAGLRRGSVPPPPSADTEPDDDVTVLRRPSHPAPEDNQATVVRNLDAEPIEVPDEIGSVPITLASFDRSETVVTHVDSTVAGEQPQANEETAIGAIDRAARDAESVEQTSLAAMDHDETVVGPAPTEETALSASPQHEETVASAAPASEETVAYAEPASEDTVASSSTSREDTALGPAPGPDFFEEADAEAEAAPDWELDSADRTQISRAPAAPFSPAPVSATPAEPEPGDRTVVAPAAVVTFTPSVALSMPAQAPSSTPTVPAGSAIDPHVLPSSARTLPGSDGPPPALSRPQTPPVQSVVQSIAQPSAPLPAALRPVGPSPFDGLDEFDEEPTMPPPMPAVSPVEEETPAEAPAPVAAAPIAAAPAPYIAPAPMLPVVMPAHVAPPNIAPPWPAGPSGLTGQYTSANATFSMSDMDASMIASIGGRGRTIKLIALVLIVASVVSFGFYLALRPPAPDPKPAEVAVEKAPPPVRVEKALPPVDDIAADVAATPNDLVAAGDRAMSEGRTENAESLYQRAIVREPKHLGALLGLGRLQLAASDVEKAAGYFRRAVGANPNDGAARIALGDALVKQGNLAEARKQYRKAKSLKHPDAAARLAAL